MQVLARGRQGSARPGLTAGGRSTVFATPPTPDSEGIVKRNVRLLRPGGGVTVSGKLQAAGMTVEEVMTRPVVVIHTDATFCVMANLLRRHRISGLPVVDGDHRLVGMVSESDLLRRLVRAETVRVFADQGPFAAPGCQSRATAESAGGLMSEPAVSTTPRVSVDEALQLMHRHGVRRLPVVDEGRHVVGIVTRTDLLQPYACTDQELRDELRHKVLPRLGVDPGPIRLDVVAGNVLMGGTLADTGLAAQVEEAVRDTPGVVFVESRLRGRRPRRRRQKA